MRKYLSILGFLTLALATVAQAQDTPREQNIRKLSANIAAAHSVNEHIVYNQLMSRVIDVEKAVELSLDYRLALRVADCAELAAHPDDPGRYGSGVNYSKVEAQKAISTCEEAYTNGGKDIGLVLASLSRAFNKAKKYDLSLSLAKQAVSLDYPYAYVIVAQHYHFGDGVKKDALKQFNWFKKSAEKGVASGMRATADNYTDGYGTKVDYNQAFYWAKQAIKKKEGKALYQVGQLLEGKAKNNPHANRLLALAKESYEVAAENGVTVTDNIKNINKKLNPNSFSPHALEFKTLSGRKVNGKFVPEQVNGNWYLLKTDQSDNNGNIFAYARTSYERNLLTVWYQHSTNKSASGWYVSFSYNGQLADVDTIRVNAILDGSNENIDLDLSDVKIVNDLFSSRMIARITYRDVLVLSRGELVTTYYKIKNKKNTPEFTMALNDAEIFTKENKTQTAKIVLTKLIQAARKLDSDCCKSPEINPLSERYAQLHKICSTKEYDHSILNKGIEQDCDMVFKNAKDNFQLIVDPLNSNLERLLNDVEFALKNT